LEGLVMNGIIYPRRNRVIACPPSLFTGVLLVKV